MGRAADLELMASSMKDCAAIIAPDGRIQFGNGALEREFGPWRGKLCHEYLHGLEAPCGWCRSMPSCPQRDGASWEQVFPRNGKSYEVTCSSVRQDDGSLLTLEFLRDVSGRGLVERQLRKLKNAYAALSDTNQAIIRAESPEGLLADVCRILIERCGLKGTWIGLLDHSGIKLRIAASSGFNKDYIEKIRISLDDPLRGNGPAGIAMKTGKSQICNDFLGLEAAKPWHEQARAAGIYAVALIPFLKNGKPCGVLAIDAGERDFFDKEMVEMVEELASDIALALDGFDSRREKAEAEKALALSEERYRRISEDMPLLICRFLPDSTLLYVNSAHEKYFEIQASKAIGMKFTSFMPSDESDEVLRMLSRIKDSTSIVVDERLYVPPAGEPRWLRWLNRGIADASGRIIEIQAIGEDITEMKLAKERIEESERSFRLLFERMSSAFADHELILDADGRPSDIKYLAVNPAFEKMTGKKASEIVGNTIGKMFKFSHDFWFNAYSKVALTGEPVRFERYSPTLKRWLSVSAFKISHLRFGSILEDVSARKETEAAILDAKLKAEEGARAKNEFLACMSHEIRTPLNAILGMSELLKSGSSLSGEEEDYCEIIIESGFKLMDTINDILEYSRLESGAFKMELSKFNLRVELEGVRALMSPLAAKKGIDFCMEFEDGFQPLYEGAPLQMRQIAVNLIGNALKFTSSGSVKVKVSSRLGVDGMTELSISVSDTGIGISQEAMGRLFQPFYQEDSSSSRRFGGTGLGLAISKKLALSMGGDIKAESSKGHGSTFTFSVPLLPALSAPDVEGLRSAGSPLRSLGINAKALVVEDNSSNGLLMKKILEKLGISAELAEDGLEALSLFRAGSFDVVFMDLRMPGMDGFQVADGIREIERELGLGSRVPIVAVTAEVISGERERWLEAGMDGFISKPVRTRQVEETVKSLLSDRA